MYKINIITVGKNKEEWVEDSIQHYLKFLKKYASVTLVYLPEIKGSKNLTEDGLRRAEAAAIASRLSQNVKIALSDRGIPYDSASFAALLRTMLQNGAGLDFIVGGIYGLDKYIIEQCRMTLSLSPLTMSHQLVRPVLLEQLYRAFSIIHGGRYHK